MPCYEGLEINWKHILEKHPYMTREIIDAVLEEPCNEHPARHDGRRRFHKTLNGEKFVVVVKEINGYEAYVITGYRVWPPA